MAGATQANGRARGPRVPLLNTPEPEPLAALSHLRAATPNLDAAVLRVQATAGKLITNEDGRVGPRTYRYVTLDAVTDEVLPLLVAEQLLWKTFPTALDGEPALRYRMTHVPSGEYDEDTMLLLCDRTSQGQGSGDTYARRYSLVAYLNLTVDPDDDGKGANLQPVDRYAEAEAEHDQLDKNSNSPQPVAPPAKRTARRRTAKQQTMLEAKQRAAKLSDGEFANVILAAAGDPPRAWADENHASQTLRRLLEHLPAKLVDAVIAGITAAGEGGKS